MVIFVVTKKGFKEMEPIVMSGVYPVWVGASVITQKHLDILRESNIDITDFSYVINPENDQELDVALSTIAEHHPGERVWVECKPKI